MYVSLCTLCCNFVSTLMCGIFLTLCKDSKNESIQDVVFKFHPNLSRRGPDVRDELKSILCGWYAHFIGYVLWTQGSKPTKQPLIDSNGNILLWNGDIFSGAFDSSTTCDSIEILKHFGVNEDEVPLCLTQINGPYAFIFWDNRTKCLWFGRDVIGRQSLLWKIESDSLVLTSTSHKDATDILEVPATGIFKLNLLNVDVKLEIEFFPWRHSLENTLPSEVSIPIFYKKEITHFLLQCGEKDSEWLREEPQNYVLEVYQMISSTAKDVADMMDRFLKDVDISERVDSFINVLSRSVQLRVTKKPNLCRKCTYEDICNHTKIGVLFSGGLDSTVIALLADKYIPEDEGIDLYNVSFENPTKKDSGFNVPDRKTGVKSFEELKRLCPTRNWRFIQIDVTQEELKKWRQDHVCHLVHPLNTVLDDSLGCALWFASRGCGIVSSDESYYESSTRVILLGMGADEMLGGYMRHRKQWKIDNSWISLSKTLANDISIIGRRNLGRDNRVLADHGCQPRMPYLDEGVVSFIRSLPPWNRCYLSDELPTGVGDKLLLRLTAWKLGLKYTSTLPKRAMQFGSRIAISSEKGSNVSDRI